MSDRTVLLGIFDGLHTGHMSAVNELMKYDGEKIVYTFDTLSVCTKGERKVLLSDKEKRDMLLKLNVDRVISADFSDVRDMTGQEFCEKILYNELQAKRVVAGKNFRFGRNAADSAEELRRYCGSLGMEFVAVPVVMDGGREISTTRIRELIGEGHIVEANRLLGRRYSIPGDFSKGIFRADDEEKMTPLGGRYMVEVKMVRFGMSYTGEIMFDKKGWTGFSQSGPGTIYFESYVK